jgi:hypothetical protein
VKFNKRWVDGRDEWKLVAGKSSDELEVKVQGISRLSVDSRKNFGEVRKLSKFFET